MAAGAAADLLQLGDILTGMAAEGFGDALLDVDGEVDIVPLLAKPDEGTLCMLEELACLAVPISEDESGFTLAVPICPRGGGRPHCVLRPLYLPPRGGGRLDERRHACGRRRRAGGRVQHQGQALGFEAC